MDNALGIFIATKRNDLGLTQRELANAVGVEQQSISRWEEGKATVKTRYLGLLARALHVEPSELFYLAGIVPPQPQESDSLVALIRRGVHALNDDQLLDVVDAAWMVHRTRRATSQ